MFWCLWFYCLLLLSVKFDFGFGCCLFTLEGTLKLICFMVCTCMCVCLACYLDAYVCVELVVFVGVLFEVGIVFCWIEFVVGFGLWCLVLLRGVHACLFVFGLLKGLWFIVSDYIGLGLFIDMVYFGLHFVDLLVNLVWVWRF